MLCLSTKEQYGNMKIRTKLFESGCCVIVVVVVAILI